MNNVAAQAWPTRPARARNAAGRLAGRFASRFASTAARKAAAPLLGAGLLLPLGAQAVSATGAFNITATVLTSCSVTAADLAFGLYDPGSATDATATTTVSVTCSLLTPYTLGINNGNNAAGSTRRMASGTSRLTYEIYRDPGMTGIFGAVAAALGLSGVGIGLPALTTIYGKIPKKQVVAPGGYSDQITVTVDY